MVSSTRLDPSSVDDRPTALTEWQLQDSCLNDRNGPRWAVARISASGPLAPN